MDDSIMNEPPKVVEGVVVTPNFPDVEPPSYESYDEFKEV